MIAVTSDRAMDVPAVITFFIIGCNRFEISWLTAGLDPCLDIPKTPQLVNFVHNDYSKFTASGRFPNHSS
jgi:hypothetical protein